MANYTIKLDADEADLDRAIERSVDKLDRLAERASSVSIGGSAGSGVSAKGGLTADPWARYERATAALDLDPGSRVLQLQKVKAARTVENAERALTGEDRLDKLARMKMGGVFPMVSQVAEMMGPAGLLAAGLTYGAIQAAEAGGVSRHDLGSAYHIGGGSTGGTAQVGAVGRFLDRSASQSAGAAVQFGGALHDSTYGAGYFRAQGIVDFGGITVDKDRNYINAVRKLSEEPNRDIATRVARDTGLTDELWMRDLSRRDRDEILAGLDDKVGDDERADVARRKAQGGRALSALGKAARIASDVIFMPADDVNLDGDRIMRRNIAVSYGLPAGSNDAVIDQYERDHHLPSTASQRGVKVSTAKPSATSGVSVRTQAGQSGGGSRVQSSMPPMAKAQQLTQNIEAYGKYCGGFPG